MKTGAWILGFSLPILFAPVVAAQSGRIGATRLDYKREPGTSVACPDEETFRNLVAARMEGGEDPFADAGPSTMEVKFTKEKGTFQATAKILDAARQVVGENQRAGSDCERLARDVALVVSLALVPAPKPPDSAPPAPAPAPPAPPRVVQEPAKRISGPEIDVSGGYAVVLGQVAGADLLYVTFGTILVGLDAGYRVNETFSIGMYGQYGSGLINPDVRGWCDALSCTLSVYRFGIGAQLHTNPRGIVDPWFNLRLGYEVFDFSAHGVVALGNGAAAGDFEEFLHGPEFLQAQFGVDFSAGPLHFGPYLGASIGTFVARKARYVAINTDGKPQAAYTESLNNFAPHTWPTLGVRVALGF